MIGQFTRIMFNRCRQLQISLNLKKCIFVIPFGMLLGHVICRQGIYMDPTKVIVIINIKVTKTLK